MKSKIERPYCKIDGVVYKLHVSSTGTIRFPDDGRLMPDLNKMVINYIEGKIPLSDLFEYYINSGCSYELVRGIFSHRGINNHITKQGKEPTKSFRYYGKKS